MGEFPVSIPFLDPVAVGDIIDSGSDRYEVEKILGSGAFGVVSMCNKASTDRKVALKVILDDPAEEADTLRTLMDHGGARSHIVEWFGSFSFNSYFVHEFEVLDMCLVDYIERNGTLKLKQLRPILDQMGTALSFLKRLGIVHMDLKHDNIMMVDTVCRPLWIKIIDFGQAQHVSKIEPGVVVQTRPHRAPEVFLGVPYDEGIDMWSIGCIVMELFLGRILFHGCNDHTALCKIIRTLGLPSYEMLEEGRYTNVHLTYHYSHWTFKESDEVAPTTSTLADIFKYTPVNEADQCDAEMFLDLVSQMLQVNPVDRISPEDLLKHPFVTMDHLEDFWDRYPEFVLECDDVLCALTGCVYEGDSDEEDDDDYDDTTMNITSSEKGRSGPPEEHTSSGREQSGLSPSRKRRREEDQDTMSGKRLCVRQVSTPKGPSHCVEPVPAPEGPSHCVEPVPAPEGPSHCVEPVPAPEGPSHCVEPVPAPEGPSHCVEPVPAPEGPSHCVEPVPAPEGPSQSGQSVTRPTDSKMRKRRHETEAESRDLHLDSDLQYGKRVCVGPVSSPEGPSHCEYTVPAPEDPFHCEEPVPAPESPVPCEVQPKVSTVRRKRRFVESACSTDSPSCCEGPAPAPEGPSHSGQSVTRPTDSRKRRRQTEAESRDLHLDFDLQYGKRLCVGPVSSPEGPSYCEPEPQEPVPAPEGPPCCEEPVPAPEGPSCSVPSVARPKDSRVRRKRPRETDASHLHQDSDNPVSPKRRFVEPVIERLSVGQVSPPEGPSSCQEPAPAPEGPSSSQDPAPVPEGPSLPIVSKRKRR